MALTDFISFIRGKVANPEQRFLQQAADMGKERVTRYRLYEDYYGGDHKTRLTERAKQYLQASGITFAENFCEPVVDALAQRLSVNGFDCEDDAIAEFTRDTWDRNRMDGAQGAVHYPSLIKGDGFVLVDWDAKENRPRITPNRPEIVKVIYDDADPRHPIFASKVWNTSQSAKTNPNGASIRRMNLYFPDRVEKWFSPTEDGHWLMHLDEDAEANVVDWTRPDGTPRGVPAFHFRNKSHGTTWGTSEIHGTIPQQDALNKMLIDLYWVMDGQGWPQRYLTGATEETVLKAVPGELWWAGEATAKFGQLDAADPEKAIAAVEHQVKRMAARSQTPLHLMFASGQLPSGESLKTAEAPLVKKAKDRHVTFGNTWEDAMRMCVYLANDFGGAQINEENLVTLAAQWENPESRDDLGEVETAEAKHRLGVSKATLLAELGYDPDEEAEKRKDEGLEEMARFDAGIVPPNPMPVDGA